MLTFYEIRTVYIKNAIELMNLIASDRVVDYHLCNGVVNGKFKVLLVLEV